MIARILRYAGGGACPGRTLSLAVAIIFLALLCPAALPASQEAQVAVVGPMVGTSSAVGMQYKVGVNAALQNLPQGRLLGRVVKVNLYDDSCDDTIAESVAREIAAQPPAVVIGHSCSGATISGAPIYARSGVLQITPASTNPKVTEMGIGTIFRMIGRDDVQGELAARRIADLHKGKKVGVLYFPGAYTSGLAKTAMEAMQQFGVIPEAKIVATASEASYANEIISLVDQGIEVLYLAGGGLDNGIFVRQARQMNAPFDVIGSDTMVSEVFRKAAGPAADNVPFTFPPEATGLPSAAPAVAAIEAMGQDPAGYTLLAYAATQVWIEGVNRAQTFEADAVAEAIRSAPVQTILGEVSFDAKGDIATSYPPFAWYVWKDGKRVPAE